MTSFSGLGIGLSLVFGCLLLALVAELYYVLWWKKRIPQTRGLEDDYTNYAKELIHLFCWKKRSSSQSHNTQSSERERAPVNGRHEVVAPDLELGTSTTTTTTSKDLFLKAFGDESEVSELMRLHNLAGPPRFLFTIKEETNEDLESDDGKSRGDRSRKGSRTRSLSDLIVTLDSPFLTPLASPTLKASPLAAYHNRGFNPLFESSAEADLNRLRSSPPPKFKFLRDAEEKLLKKLMKEAEKRVVVPKIEVSTTTTKVQDCSGVKSLNTATSAPEVIKEGSFLKFIVGNHHLTAQCHPSSSSQVLPLASSPTTTTLRPLDNQKANSALEC